jgi:hypothetical protein
LGEIADDVIRRGMTFAIADLHHRPRMLLERAGFFDRIGPNHVFDHLEQAVRALEATTETTGTDPKRYL